MSQDRARDDAGQGALEYLGITILAALLVVGVVVGVGNGNPVQARVMVAICDITQVVGGGCGSTESPGGDDETGEDQPWQCDWFGIGCNDEDEGDENDEGESEEGKDQPWHCDWFGIGCNDDGDNGEGGGEDGGEDTDVDIPDGLDPDSDLVQTLLSTERGRETLQWLADNDIPIVTDSGETGAYWNGTEIVLGEGYDDAAVLVHEANHAEYTVEGRSADASELDRDDYVREAILEEANGVVQQILAAQEFREQGYEIADQPSEDIFTEAYDEARQEALDSGASATEADQAAEQAGLDAVNQSFYDGGIVTSTTGESYPDFYGNYWDSVNPR